MINQPTTRKSKNVIIKSQRENIENHIFKLNIKKKLIIKHIIFIINKILLNNK